MELRISAGKYKNIRLNVPESARPVMERVKLAVFSIIADKIEGSRVLDLYAGSGNLGFEALSRGASYCQFTDTDYFAVKAVKDNIDKIALSSHADVSADVTREDGLKFAANSAENFDLIFVDPPYNTSNKHLFKLIDEIMNPGALIVYFSNHSNDITENLSNLNENLKIIDARKYGITYVDIIRKTSHSNGT